MSIRTLIAEAGFGKMFRELMFPGVAGVAIAIAIGFFELLKGNPAAAMDLLKAWGPGFLLGMLAIAVVGSFLGQLVDAQKDSVAAQRQVAVALTQAAERDDRERDRMATETAYMAQRMDRTLAIVEKMADQVVRIEERLQAKESSGGVLERLAEQVSVLEKRLDVKGAGG